MCKTVDAGHTKHNLSSFINMRLIFNIVASIWFQYADKDFGRYAMKVASIG